MANHLLVDEDDATYLDEAERSIATPARGEPIHVGIHNSLVAGLLVRLVDARREIEFMKAAERSTYTQAEPAKALVH